MVATQYLPPVTDTPAIGTIDHSAGYLVGATSIVVTTLQGTFPAPAAGQAFVAIVNPNTSGLLDNATTERCIVTVNASGTWTIPAGLAFNHANGEYVAIVVSTTWLDNLLQLAGGTMSGPIDMGSAKITDLAAGSESTDAVNVSQIAGALQASNDLSDVANAGTSRANLHVPALTPVAACSNGLGNISISSAPATLDTVGLNNGDLILLVAQSTPSQDGLWTFNGAGEALTRPTEFADGATIKGRTVLVEGGSIWNAQTTWALTTPTAGIVIDTTPQTWYPTATPYGLPVLIVTSPQFSAARYDTGVTISAGSSLVLDSSIAASDAGALVTSPCFANYQFGVYVSDVTPGVSFVASSSPTAVIPVPAGFSLRSDTASGSTANDVIIDTSILAADQGQPVAGTHIPAGSFVGTVTAGTSFQLSSSPNSQVNVSPTGTVTAVRVGQRSAIGSTTPQVGIGTGGPCLYGNDCIQNAINALPASGGVVYLPQAMAGANYTAYPVYVTSYPIIVGNGTNQAALVTSGSSAGGATDWGSTRSDTATWTTSSPTITDSSVLATDIGAPVSGTGIPVPAFVGTVTAGVSFQLSASPTSQVNVNPTAGTGGTVVVTPMFIAATSALANLYPTAATAAGQTLGTTGTTVLGTAFSDPNASFNATMVNEPITIYGAGVSGAALTTYIAAVNSATSITLGLAASTAITGSAVYFYGNNVCATIIGSISSLTATSINFTRVDSAGFHGCSYPGGGSGSGYGPTPADSVAVGTISTKQGVVLQGAQAGFGAIVSGGGANAPVVGGVPGVVIMYLGGNLPQNAPSGAAIIDIVGPIQGWGVNNISLWGNAAFGSGLAASGHGIRITNGQQGQMDNVFVTQCATTGIMVRCWPWSPAAPTVGSIFNYYRQVQVVVPGTAAAVGINIGGTETTLGAVTGGCDTYLDTWEQVWVDALDPGSSVRNYCVRFGQSDDCTIRNLVCNGSVHSWAVIFDYEGGNFGGNGTWTTSSIPFANTIDDYYVSGSILGTASGGALTDGVNLGTAPGAGNWNRIINVSAANGTTVPPAAANAGNLTWGNNASNVPIFGSQTFVSGTGAQCTTTNKCCDNLAYITVTEGGTLTIALGPSSAASAATIVNAQTVVEGQVITVRVPALYYMKITAVTATYTTELQALC